MILGNYTFLLGNLTSGITTDIKPKNIEGASNVGVAIKTDIWKSTLQTYTFPNNYGDRGKYIGFGTGTTAPTINDYKLENAILTGLSIVNVALTINTANFNSSYETLTSTVINDSTEDIIINEVGMAITINPAGTGGAYLLTREVLAEPVTIKPSETYTFTITISL